jgi:hypothetical protein
LCCKGRRSDESNDNLGGNDDLGWDIGIAKAAVDVAEIRVVKVVDMFDTDGIYLDYILRLLILLIATLGLSV